MNEEIFTHPLLQDHYSIDEAEALQLEWALKREEIEKDPELKYKLEKIRWIAGVDISFPKMRDPTWGVACAVLWDYKTNKKVSHEIAKGDLNFNYIPGFLGFRENKLIAQTILKLPKIPDVIMCDGHGIAHPRKIGEAVHLGIALKIPSFGVAKNPFYGVSNWKELQKIKGHKTPIWSKEQKGLFSNKREILGYATCLANNRKPVFISQGLSISLDDAIKISLDTTFQHRQPEPLFLADQLSRKEIKN